VTQVQIETGYFVHESSCVDDGAEIGPGTKIWHFSHVMADSRIGARCSLGQNVFVASNVLIGNDVKIQNNVSIYEGVELEDEVFCGPSVVFTNVRTPRSGRPRKNYAVTKIRRGASLGANCTIVCGTTIGEFALIGAGSVVTKDVSPHSIVYGNPAQVRGYACQCGLPLAFSDLRATCTECGRRYAMDNDEIARLPE
jgi:UDP-2-acetamido-3-amino-2,3-dideoxy-glucuronate N-acetyltransferase